MQASHSGCGLGELTAPHPFLRSQSLHSPRLGGLASVTVPGNCSPRRGLLGLMSGPSVSSCADVCTCSSLCPCVPANVAAHLTNLAIIVQRAPWQGCRGEGATRWRSLRPKCAEKLELGFPQPPPGHGLGRVQQLGLTAFGGCRTRFHSMARCAARHRHDPLSHLSGVTGLPGPGCRPRWSSTG